MSEKLIVHYYKFFDETIESTTFVVLFITLLIFVVGTFVPSAHAAQSAYLKTSILEVGTHDDNINTVRIDGFEYKVNFEKLHK